MIPPDVSIIIPVYNAEDYIKESLNSILNERDVPLEVIVVNDRCTDNSLKIINEISDARVRIISGLGEGFIRATNLGVSSALGRIIMRCDADDKFDLARIKRQLQWLDDHPEFGAVCGNYATIDARGQLVVQLACGDQSEEITEELRQGRLRNHFCTFAIRAAILKQVQGRSELNISADLDWQLRIGEACRVWYLPTTEYYYRLHDDSLTHKRKKQELKFYDQLVLTLQQQRLSQGKDDLELGKPLPSPRFEIDEGIDNSAIAHIQGQLIGQAWREHQSGQKWAALKTGWRCLRLHPWRWDYWRSVLALLLKPAGRS